MNASPKTVMVAEDELVVRMVAVAVLMEAGFDVVEAEHADHALSLLNVRADGIHVLFTDVHMPGEMNGLELAHHVRRSWPWIALLVASGALREHELALPDGCRFLPKPYDPDHVVHHVRLLTAT